MKAFPAIFGVVVFVVTLASGIVATRLMCDRVVFGPRVNELYKFLHLGDAMNFVAIGSFHSLIVAIVLGGTATLGGKRRIAHQPLQLNLRSLFFAMTLVGVYLGLSVCLSR